MAPACTARRLLLPLLCVFLMFLSLFTSKIESLLVYDRQSLLDLQQNFRYLSAFYRGEKKILPPHLSEIPTHLLRVSALPCRRKRFRRRGKRSGRMVKMRIYLAHSTYGSRTVGLYHGSSYPFTLSRRFLDPVDSCLIPVTGLSDVAPSQLRNSLSPRVSASKGLISTI